MEMVTVRGIFLATSISASYISVRPKTYDMKKIPDN